MPSYGDFAWVYDLLNTEAEYEKRAEYIHNLLCRYGCREGILLDLACGTGTMCELFAKKGYDMIGVDASEDMLTVAQEKKMQSGSNCQYLCQKMQKIDMFGTVAGAICTLDSINHLENAEDVKKTFQLVSLFLDNSGVFIFDVNTEHKHREILGNNTFVYDLDEAFCTWQNSYDESSKTTTIKLDIFEKDEDEDDVYYRIEEEFPERYYELEDLKKWLEEADFQVVGIYNEFTDCPVSENDQRAVFVAIRKDR